MARNDSFFKRLTTLFRSGPSIRRRIRGQNANSYYDSKLIQGNYGYRAPAPFGFGRENSPFSVLGSYGILDRMARYAEFSEMEYTPEICTALDIYADEIMGGDEHGHAFHIFSDNIQIKRALEELFYDVLNIEFNARSWARNIVKYGDFFLYNEVLPELGVINAQPIPVNEIEREEGFDEEDPYAIRFKWLTRGNVYLQNWQVSHFRILGNDMFLPYGSAILEPARRIWRQLTMMEDSMLLYRIIRSPERRVFYIDVGNVAPNDVPSYMEAAKSTLRSHSIIDRTSGRQDMRFNPLAVDEDYFIPVRGQQSGTKIDTLTGGQHVTATEDVEYIQKKLFAALKVPKPFLNFDDNLSSKATLAQTDVRFSRTIASIQKIVIAELTKLAMIHLYAKGFDGEDLINFELRLSNPSSVAQQQKLELWSTKMDIAGTARETGLVDTRWIQKNLLDLTDDDIATIDKGLYNDKIREVQLDQVAFEEEPSAATTTDAFSPSNYEMPGENVPKNPNSPQEPAPKGPGGTPITGDPSKITQNKKDFSIGYKPGTTPIKATPFMTKHKKNRSRLVGGAGRSNTSMPDFAAMLHGGKNKSLKDVYDINFLTNTSNRSEGFDPGNRNFRNIMKENDDGEIVFEREYSFTNEMKAVFKKLDAHLGFKKTTTPSSKLITEDIDLELVDDDDNDMDLEESIVDRIAEEITGEEPKTLLEILSLPNLSTDELLEENKANKDEKVTNQDTLELDFD
jgi:hypothetical protein